MRYFRDYNPAVTALYFVLCAAVVMFTQEPALLILSFAGGFGYMMTFERTRKPGGHIFRAILFLTLTLINPIFSHNGKTVIFYMGDTPFTFEALFFGVIAAGTVVTVLCHFGSFSEIMTKDRLLYLLGAVAPKFALVLSMGFRYVPLYLRQYKKVRDAQKATGLYRESNIVDRIRGNLRIFSIMTTWALEKGIITADSMAARGYGTGRRTRMVRQQFTLSDGVTLALILSLFASTLVFFVLSGKKTVFYPSIALTEFSPAYALCCLCYGLLCVLPLIIDLKEALKWKYSASKI